MKIEDVNELEEDDVITLNNDPIGGTYTVIDVEDANLGVTSTFFAVLSRDDSDEDHNYLLAHGSGEPRVHISTETPLCDDRLVEVSNIERLQ